MNFKIIDQNKIPIVIRKLPIPFLQISKLMSNDLFSYDKFRSLSRTA